MQRLYHLPLSPFCRKVRLVLAEKKIEMALVEERPWERREEFLQRNPAGQVPVLQIDERTFLADSTAIIEYLEEICPEPALMPADPLARAEVRRLIQWFDIRFHADVGVNLLYERGYKRMIRRGSPDSALIRAGTASLRVHLDYMAWLLDHRNWLTGPLMTLADLTAAAHISALDYCGDIPWAEIDTHRAAHLKAHPWESVRSWYTRLKSRRAFHDLLTDHIPGMPPASHYADLDY